MVAAAASEWVKGRGEGVSSRWFWFIAPDKTRECADGGGLDGGKEFKSGGILSPTG